MKNKINIFGINKNIIKRLLILFLILINTEFLNAKSNKNIIYCGTEIGKNKYNCQVKNLCKQFKPEEFHYKTKPFFSEEEGENNLLKKVKKIYRENQNNIYSCAIIKLQKNSYDLVRKKLISGDKTGSIKSIIDKKFNFKIKKLKQIEKRKKCIFPANKKEDINSIIFKQKLLKESSYEFCKYNFYLNYLEGYYKNIENLSKELYDENTSETVKKFASYGTSQLEKKQISIQNDISEEINHSSKVFSMVFQTYIDYENNFPVHILLELIKEDFIVYRQKLHETISPLNQVVYKIKNAMGM